MRLTARSATAAVAALVLLSSSACSSSGSSSSKSPVSGGTLTYGIGVDPGNLDPQRTVVNANLAIDVLAYDTPLTLNQKNQLVPGVLTSWRASGAKSWILTVRKGVTCADGSVLDAKTVADNLNYVANPKSASVFANLTVPTGSNATYDNAAGTVSVTLGSPAPFFMQDLTLLPLVCEKGLANRKILANGSDGSGPYVISQVVPGDQITYSLREGYNWGPPGAVSNAAKGIPAKVVVKVVTSPTTTSNLLLSGQLNTALVSGTDQARLKAAGLSSVGVSVLNNELVFNQAKGSPWADSTVRRALVGILNLDQVAKVDTGGLGAPATGLLADPKVCPGNTLKGSLPSVDVGAAKSMLSNDGWMPGPDGVRAKSGAKLSMTLLYASDQPTTAASAEFMASQWKQLGVSVSLVQKPTAQAQAQVLGGTIEWNALLVGITVSTPAELVPLLTGNAPPKGGDFGQINNTQYNTLIAQASQKNGTEGCADWNAAETALFKNADIVPLSTLPTLYWNKNASFDVNAANNIMPTTIRLFAH